MPVFYNRFGWVAMSRLWFLSNEAALMFQRRFIYLFQITSTLRDSG